MTGPGISSMSMPRRSSHARSGRAHEADLDGVAGGAAQDQAGCLQVGPSVAIGWVWRQVAQVVTAVVASKAKMSARSPAVTLPSRGAGFISCSCRSEAFGLDEGGLVAEADERGADGFDERCRSAHVAAGSNRRWPADLAEQVGVDPPAPPGPRRRRLPGEGEGDGTVTAVGQRRAARRRRSRRRACAPSRRGASPRCCPMRAWWRIIAISGTTPEPPPTSSTGVVSSPSHTNQPPIGPRSSSWSPTSATVVRYGDTSPSSMRTTVSSTRSAPGGDAIE